MERRIYLHNPLPQALRHYSETLTSVLQDAKFEVESVEATSVEGMAGLRAKASTSLRSLVTRLRLLKNSKGMVISTWPSLGLLDLVAWIPVALRHRVFVIYHDPEPIRDQHGYSPVSRLAFRIAARIPRIEVVAHTQLAATALKQGLGVAALVFPHPIGPSEPDAIVSNGLRRVTVLGQFKPSRDVAVLEQIGNVYGLAESEVELSIRGRGWPNIAGWTVTDRFISEEEFNEDVRSSSCIVIPYSRFYQSGVATRCLEMGTPVLAPKHEHIAQLFGDDWPGMVVESDGWARALTVVLNLRRGQISTRARLAREGVVDSWRQFPRPIG